MAKVPMISENINLMSLTITNDKNIVINQGHKENVIIIWDQDNKLLCLFILQNRYHCKNNYLIQIYNGLKLVKLNKYINTKHIPTCTTKDAKLVLSFYERTSSYCASYMVNKSR